MLCISSPILPSRDFLTLFFTLSLFFLHVLFSRTCSLCIGFSIITLSEACQDDVARRDLLGPASSKEEVELLKCCGFGIGADELDDAEGEEESAVDPHRVSWHRQQPAPASLLLCLGHETIDGALMGKTSIVCLDRADITALLSHVRSQVPQIQVEDIVRRMGTSFMVTRRSQASIGSTVFTSRLHASRASHDPCCVCAVVPRSELVRVDGITHTTKLQGQRFGEVQFFFSMPVYGFASPLLLAKVLWRAPVGIENWSPSSWPRVRRREDGFAGDSGGYCSIIPVHRIVSSCAFVPDFEDVTAYYAVSLRHC